MRYGLLKTNLTRNVAIKVINKANPNPSPNPNPNPITLTLTLTLTPTLRLTRTLIPTKVEGKDFRVITGTDGNRAALQLNDDGLLPKVLIDRGRV